MAESEQLLADLRKRSLSIAPLRLRRTNINKPITLESLCDWETDKVALLRRELKKVPDVHPLFFSFFLNMSFLTTTTRSLYREDRKSPSNPTRTP